MQKMPPDSVVGDVTAATSAPSGAAADQQLELAAELINRAHQTGARVRIIEDVELLKDHGGVAAALRFRV